MMSNTIEASIRDGSDVDTTGAITIEARDEADIDADVTAVAVSLSAGGGAALSVAVAISEAQVDYSTQTLAQIHASGVRANSGDLRLKALSTGTIDVNADAGAVSFSGSGGLSLSGSGTGAIATVTSSSLTKASIFGGSDVDLLSGSLFVDADDETIITTDAGSGSGSNRGGGAPIVSGQLQPLEIIDQLQARLAQPPYFNQNWFTKIPSGS